MYCPHCGTQNPEDASFCVECAKRLAPEKSTHKVNRPPPDPPPPDPPPPSQQVPNYFVPAILTLFCCTPLGVVAVVHAAQVNTQLAAGNYAAAAEASQKAKKWAIIAAVAGVVGWGLYFLVVAGSTGF